MCFTRNRRCGMLALFEKGVIGEWHVAEKPSDKMSHPCSQTCTGRMKPAIYLFTSSNPKLPNASHANNNCSVFMAVILIAYTFVAFRLHRFFKYRLSLKRFVPVMRKTKLKNFELQVWTRRFQSKSKLSKFREPMQLRLLLKNLRITWENGYHIYQWKLISRQDPLLLRYAFPIASRFCRLVIYVLALAFPIRLRLKRVNHSFLAKNNIRYSFLTVLN